MVRQSPGSAATGAAAASERASASGPGDLEDLDDLRLAASLLGAGSFTAAAARLGIPKQTLSRRIARLEARLEVRLVERTTRAFRITPLGRTYAERCAEIVRLADEANREVRGEARLVAGTLRLTADPLFGERFLPPLLVELGSAHPDLRIDVVLTSRAVDLVDEGFDVAIRVGSLPDSQLVATRIAEARLVLVASPAYVQAHGRPRSPADLPRHRCIGLVPEGATARWAFRDPAPSAAQAATAPPAVRWMEIAPVLRVNHPGLALQACLAGLGITNLPGFACAEALDRGELVPVLARHLAAFGVISIVHPTRRLVSARVRRFLEIAVPHLRARPELR